MLKLHAHERFRELGFRVILQVHDEVGLRALFASCSAAHMCVRLPLLALFACAAASLPELPCVRASQCAEARVFLL